MQEVILNVIEDSFGSTGLAVEGIKMFEDFNAAIEGALIAHDVLEHQQGFEKIGSIGDELIALGGVWFIRGEVNDITGKPSMHSAMTHVASEVARMADYVILSQVPIREDLDPTINPDECYDYELIVREAKQTFYNERLEDIKEQGIKLSQINHYFDAVINLMAKGYRMADDRLKCQQRANTMFWEIARQIDTVAKQIHYPGQQFILSYCLESQAVYVDEYYPEDDY